jgi:hypothetical protein
LDEWLRFPFAIAGPIAVAAYIVFGALCVAIAMFVAEGSQGWAVIGAFVVVFGPLELQRRSFMRRRGLEYRFRFLPSGGRNHAPDLFRRRRSLAVAHVDLVVGLERRRPRGTSLGD